MSRILLLSLLILVVTASSVGITPKKTQHSVSFVAVSVLIFFKSGGGRFEGGMVVPVDSNEETSMINVDPFRFAEVYVLNDAGKSIRAKPMLEEMLLSQHTFHLELCYPYSVSEDGGKEDNDDSCIIN